MSRCRTCGYELGVDCECSACEICERWLLSHLLARNPDGDWSCPECTAAGRRHPESVAADADNDITTEEASAA